MCRSGYEINCAQARHRCLGSTGERRRAVDRARYAGKPLAARVKAAPGGRLGNIATIAPGKSLPTVASLRVLAAEQPVIASHEGDELLDETDVRLGYDDEDDDDAADGGPAAPAVVRAQLTEPLSQHWVTDSTLREQLRRPGTGLTLRGSWKRSRPDAAWEPFVGAIAVGQSRTVVGSASGGTELDTGEILATGSGWHSETGLAVHETSLRKTAWSIQVPERDGAAAAAAEERAAAGSALAASDAATAARAAVLAASDASAVLTLPDGEVLAGYRAWGAERVAAGRLVLEAEAVGVTDRAFVQIRDHRYPELLSAEVAAAEAWSTRLRASAKAAAKRAGAAPSAAVQDLLDDWRAAVRGVDGDRRVLSTRLAGVAA